MPLYYHLRYKVPDPRHRLRAVRNLRKLRAQLDATVPFKDAESTLLLATWNIRDFDKSNRRGHGKRLPETMFYIAEVLSRFDFVAVQEVNSLVEWGTVMDILGGDYDYIASDVTDTSLGGNGERLLFLYDKRKVFFQNVIGEIVLPTHMLITPNREGEDEALFVGKQFRRSPYVGRFQSKWFKFAICTVHIYYGSESGDKLEQRIQEISRIAEYFSERADEELRDGRALIILGDFNIVHPEHQTMDALRRKGFTVPTVLRLRTNFKQNKFYDQIAFKTRAGVIDFIEGTGADGKPNAGLVDLFQEVMTENDAGSYLEDLKAAKNANGLGDMELESYFDEWKTYQLSDHFPLWARLSVNSSAAYLDRLEEEFAGPGDEG